MSSDLHPAWLVEPTVFAKTGFDYLIIGGGTAGLTLASRLSENSSFKVGVIEAGPYLPDDPQINTPAHCFPLKDDKYYNWNIMTTPQVFGNQRSIHLPSGKVLGGTSSINLMAYLRGSKADYDNWEALGNPGWNWENLLPYFKKSETASPQDPEVVFPGISPSEIKRAAESTNDYRGSDGPLKVSYNKVYNPLIHPSVKALNALGIPTNIEPEYGTAIGVFNAPRTVDQVAQKRWHAVPAYLGAAKGRDNIQIVTNAHAVRVIFSEDPLSGKLLATGVEFISGGESFLAQASKEVIISTGALQTPKVLELSGIGSKALLSSHGIKCLIDLPQVGENYQDHVAVTCLFELHPKTETDIDLTPPPDKTSTLSTFSFFPLKKVASESTIKGIVDKLDRDLASYTPTPLQKAQFALYRNSIDSDIGTGEVVVTGGREFNGKPCLILSAGLQHPYSRGHVHIQSADPFANPDVDPHFLECSFDLDVLSILARFLRTVAETEPLKSIVLGPFSPPTSVESEENFRDLVKNTFQTLYHSAGTAAMAPRELGGVVDPSLLVYGTCNLRVVDASIIPLHIATHPQATIYAIAEKASKAIVAADIIKTARMNDRVLGSLRN